MHKNWIKSCFVLAVLIISLASLSSATCPWFIQNELYSAQCRVIKVVPASAGILVNDAGAVAVLNPGGITIDPKYGTIKVEADGSFVYDPSPNIQSGTYVTFQYNATNGVCAAEYAGTAKIQLSCKCRPNVMDVTICMPQDLDEVKAYLMATGAGCWECGDITPVFDLSQVRLQPGTYPYLLKCPHCTATAGLVTIAEMCQADAPAIEICEGGVTIADLPGLIQAECVGVGCGQPDIDYGNVTVANGFVSGGYYMVTCNPGTECGSWDRGDITVIRKCTVTAPNLVICEGKTLDEVEDLIEATCASDCDHGPELDLTGVTVDADGFVTGGSYTTCCYAVGTTRIRCESCVRSSITVVPKCIVAVNGIRGECFTPAELEAIITALNPSPCGTCDSTLEFDFPVWDLDAIGNVAAGIYEFSVICSAVPQDCESKGTGVAIVEGAIGGYDNGW